MQQAVQWSNATSGRWSALMRFIGAEVAALLIVMIRVYQWTLSPLLGDCCRFEPSCSRYACGCIERFGVIKGLWLSIKRVLRCQPFCAGGHDPVPELFARARLTAEETSA